jgi:hypothetical protein
MLNFFPYPVPILGTANAGGMTSAPVGLVQWSNGGGPPYNTSSQAITVDPVNGFIYFERPTAMVFGSQVTVPVNVMAFVPVATGGLAVYAPSSSTYSGTLSTVEGIQRRKVITVMDWRDASNFSNMQTYANEMLGSMQDVVVEGTVPYYGIPGAAYLAPGQSVSIAGSGYTTGWETLNLPVIACDVIFQNAESGTWYQTVLQLSNRRGRFSAAQFLRPRVAGQQLGSAEMGAYKADYALGQKQLAESQAGLGKIQSAVEAGAGGQLDIGGTKLDVGARPEVTDTASQLAAFLGEGPAGGLSPFSTAMGMGAGPALGGAMGPAMTQTGAIAGGAGLETGTEFAGAEMGPLTQPELQGIQAAQKQEATAAKQITEAETDKRFQEAMKAAQRAEETGSAGGFANRSIGLGPS